MPSGKKATPEIVDNKDGTVTVRYAPTEVGLHEMHIKYMGSHIPGKWGTVTLQPLGHLGDCRALRGRCRHAVLASTWKQPESQLPDERLHLSILGLSAGLCGCACLSL